MQMLGSREGMGGGAPSEDGGGSGYERAAPASRPAGAAAGRPAAAKSSGFSDMDDDIPF